MAVFTTDCGFDDVNRTNGAGSIALPKSTVPPRQRATQGYLTGRPLAAHNTIKMAFEKWGMRFGKLVPKVKPKDVVKVWNIVTGDLVCKSASFALNTSS